MDQSVATKEFPGGFGVLPLDQVARMSGLDFLTGIVSGSLPAPPIARTLGFTLSEVAPGRAVFTGQPDFAHYNPIGTVHGGWTATLLDSCMACAIQTTLEAGEIYTTVEIKVNYVRAVTDKLGPLQAIGELIHRGGRVATSHGRLVDASGKLYAHGSTTCMVMKP